VFFVLRTSLDAQGKPVAAWRVFWDLFGASNQLLAALTLLGVTVWLWKTRGLPTAFMYVMSTWALVSMILPKFVVDGRFVAPADPVPWVGMVLIGLAGLMLVEAVLVFLGPRTTPPSGAVPVPVGS
jgi:carbon starvation protein